MGHKAAMTQLGGVLPDAPAPLRVAWPEADTRPAAAEPTQQVTVTTDADQETETRVATRPVRRRAAVAVDPPFSWATWAQGLTSRVFLFTFAAAVYAVVTGITGSYQSDVMWGILGAAGIFGGVEGARDIARAKAGG